jgi:hypothetical protein
MEMPERENRLKPHKLEEIVAKSGKIPDQPDYPGSKNSHEAMQRLKRRTVNTALDSVQAESKRVQSVPL